MIIVYLEFSSLFLVLFLLLSNIRILEGFIDVFVVYDMMDGNLFL